ncbi:hypothetical protein EVAR_95024_1 [Eumeta japonica]|uniref:Uncharacterized protein n=1 Tax=Eumeta variegata TaxID=151549 RepID=A0A4C1VVZ7_EUMVA|nr:hypothetical protein EVAR_95024_1 [Eumeta japonica]
MEPKAEPGTEIRADPKSKPEPTNIEDKINSELWIRSYDRAKVGPKRGRPDEHIEGPRITGGSAFPGYGNENGKGEAWGIRTPGSENPAVVTVVAKTASH